MVAIVIRGLSTRSHLIHRYFMSVTTSVARNTYNTTSSSKDNSTSSLHTERKGSKMVRLMEEDEERQ
jgi:ribosomal protein L4